jgi:hypothetical protein
VLRYAVTLQVCTHLKGLAARVNETES